MNPDDVAYRCNLVTLRADSGGYDITKLGPHAAMEDFTAGQIDTLEAKELIYDINEQLGTEVVQFYAGVSYRHIMVWAEGKHRMQLMPPQDIVGKPVGEFLPKGEGEKVLRALMDAALPILREHQINVDRLEGGKPPANSLWFWGQGKSPKIPKLTERYGLTASMISALDLPRGVGLYCGFDAVAVPGATGYGDTNYVGKAESALREFKTKDLVCVHLAATDEASHQGDLQGKVKAIEAFDEQTVGPLLKELPKFGPHEPVPFVLYEGPAGASKAGRDRGFNELDAKASKVLLEDPTKLMARLIGKHTA